jgi:hypothetical protein
LSGQELTFSSKYAAFGRQGVPEIEVFLKRAIDSKFFVSWKVESQVKFSQRLEPDIAFYQKKHKKINCGGSKTTKEPRFVAEKLQTCHFKLQYYRSRCSNLQVKVNLVWVLGEYFSSRRDSFKSIFDYMNENGSELQFDGIDLKKLKII